MFKLLKTSIKSKARLGILKTAHGVIETPFFMPCATQGAVKTVSAEEIKKLGARILLANTYHLMLQPGEKLVKRAGGLHKFMDWQKPLLTDSGGFQVFSLAGGKKKNGQNLVKLTRNGVRFKSYIDGKEHYLTPEKALKIQADLGVDIAVCLDVCVKLPAGKEDLENAVELTTYWAKKTKNYFEKHYMQTVRKPSFCHSRPLRRSFSEASASGNPGEIQLTPGFPIGLRPSGMTEYKFFGQSPFLLFAVIQGGLDKKLRLQSLAGLKEIGWDGYNIGGLSVGETAEEMYGVLDYLVPEMPENKPRYLMGVGYPENIVEAVKRGVDMFDCVIPTREGRHGKLFLWKRNPKSQIPNPKTFYQSININRSKFAKNFSLINENSKIPELRQCSLSYLHHLFKIKEPLGARLASLNNLEFYLDLMKSIKYNINNNKL
ncbi:MAG: tRNA guanosine(34) transglycosylase Tgt [bacterium]|nr:tRNA guanosine(34) transglycosylase Tgt [bacterium]